MLDIFVFGFSIRNVFLCFIYVFDSKWLWSICIRMGTYRFIILCHFCCFSWSCSSDRYLGYYDSHYDMKIADINMNLGICTIESIPTKTRTVGLTICNCFNNTASFYCLMLFPILTATIDLHGCMAIFGSACTLGAFYVYFVLEETMGKDLDSVPSNVNGISNNNC